MDFNKPPVILPEQEPDEDLHNEEVINRILVSGTVEEMERLRVTHNLTLEQLSLMRFYTQQRDQIHKKIDLEIEQREQTEPQATPTELEMGAYIQYIEPQVRDAVLVLRGKGYPTYASGYAGFESQNIDIETKDFSEYKPSEDLLIKLEPYDIVLQIEPSEIWFSCRRQLSVEELKEVWDLIAKDLPDLGHPAAPSELSAAEVFRKKQEGLKTL